VVAGTPALNYQWQAGAVNSGVYTNLANGNKYVGATGATLGVSNVTLADTADYQVLVSNVFGWTSSVARLTVVSGPTASFGFNPSNGVAPLAVTFTNTTASGTYTNAVWVFGDGTSQTNLSGTVMHTYTNGPAGVVPVSNVVVLTVTDSNRYQSSASAAVVLWPVPAPSFTPGGISVGIGAAVVFTNTTAGTVAGVTWNFGDNSYDNVSLNTVSHTYSAASAYAVSLWVTNAYGQAASATNSLTVTNASSGVVIGAPSITYFKVQGGTNVVIAGTNVASGGEHNYILLSSTNAALSRTNQWVPLLTNQSVNGGTFSNSVPMSGPREFYLIQVPNP
jgi:PKD repeat protein